MRRASLKSDMDFSVKLFLLLLCPVLYKSGWSEIYCMYRQCTHSALHAGPPPWRAMSYFVSGDGGCWAVMVVGRASEPPLTPTAPIASSSQCGPPSRSVLRTPQAHPVPSIGRAVPADMPTVTLEGGATFQIVLGANAGAASPANVATLPRCAFLRVRVPPGRTATVPLDPDLTEGYALVVSGVGRFAGDAADVSPQSGLVLFGPGEGLVVTNADAGAALDAVVVAGAPLAEPWVKTLGLNGFIVTESEAAGDRMMARIMERQMEFTYKDLEGLP